MKLRHEGIEKRNMEVRKRESKKEGRKGGRKKIEETGRKKEVEKVCSSTW
jgi:hypothetical protein